MHVRGRGSASPGISATLPIIFGAAATGSLLAYIVLPEVREWVASPGGLFDAISAAGFLGALVMSAIALATVGRWSWHWLTIPLVAGLGFLDRSGYGLRLIGEEPPSLGGVPVDTIEGLAGALARLADSISTPAFVLALVLGLIPIAGLVAAAGTLRLRGIGHWVRRRQCAAYAFAAAATLIWGAAAATALSGTAGPALARTLAVASATITLAGVKAMPISDPSIAGWSRRIRPWVDGAEPLAAMPDGTAVIDTGSLDVGVSGRPA